MATIRTGFLVLVAVFLSACEQAAGPEPPAALPSLYAADIGTVIFPSSCKAPADEMLERGVGLLHHMMYENARLAFSAAEQADPACVLALWGQAMSFIHPLWPDLPSPAVLEWGRQLVSRANDLSGADPRERAYLSTVAAYFEPMDGDTEQARLRRFEHSWREVADAHPEDLEARAFHTLALVATTDPRDKTYENQLAAGAMAKEIMDVVPDHPGAHHYLIHAYDNPQLAERAREVADRYGVLAPEVPHATHMMSHIYTRLGDWEKSIEWNRKSADSAWQLCLETGEITSHYQHALDYLAYAYLQLGADESALSMVKAAAGLEAPFSESNLSAAAYAFAAIPARYHLERGDWLGAAALQPATPASFPWSDEHLPYVAITHFARGLGNARLGKTAEASQDLDRLRQMRDRVAEFSSYWAEQIDIQALAIDAWIQLAAGNRNQAVTIMRRAANLEQATEKSPVTPGEVLPATELLGDMLLLTGNPDEALDAYERSLTRTQMRLNSLYGAARAAEQSGRLDEARAHYARVASALSQNAGRPEMRKQAADFLSASSA